MHIEAAFGPVTVLSISGDVDSATCSRLVDQAVQVLDGGHVHLILDLGGVEYISSGGLLALQRIANQAAALDGKLVLCAPRRHVSQVLSMTAFDTIFGIYPDVAAARASFA